MRSKFWTGDASSSSEDEPDDGFQVETPEPLKKKPVMNTRQMVFSSSEEEDTRVVKSLKDRQWDNIKQVISKLQNHMKNGDFVELAKDYENLLKAASKANAVIQSVGYPKFFVKVLYDLDECVTNQLKDKEAFKKLSKPRATSLNTLKAKFRKMSTEWLGLIHTYRTDPNSFPDDEEDDEDEEEQSEDEPESDHQSDKFDSQSEESDLDDDDFDSSAKSDWTGSESSSSSSEDGDNRKEGLSRWLIQDTPQRDKKPIKPIKKPTPITEKKSAQPVIKAEPSIVSKDIEGLFDTHELTPEIIEKRLKTVLERRGKKGIDRYEQISILKKLVEISKNVGEQSWVDVLAQLITAEFDISLGPTSFQTIDLWLETYDHMTQILKLLENNSSLYLSDINIEKSEQTDNIKTTLSIYSAFLERLDDEIYKSLQLKDLHSDVYKIRLSQTVNLMILLCRFYDFAKQLNLAHTISSICLIIMEQTYNKHDSLASKTWDVINERSTKPLKVLEETNADPQTLLNLFYSIVSKNGNHREKIHAQLYLGYNKCLHDHYYEALDLIQIPNLYDLCMQLDVHTQILYNRIIVQLGFAAFRMGNINEAYTFLADICGLNHHKELLAQAVSSMKNQEKTVEQEKAERRRLLPYHMHINIELLESIHNICAMLLEVPNKAHHRYTGFVGPRFVRILETYLSQPFQGPPENSREFVLAATKCLMKGDWKNCSKHIFMLPIWEKFDKPDEVKDILLQRIKTEAMRTYIFSYLKLYNSFSVSQLSSMFSLPPNQIHSHISKMMVNEEILASWDETSENIMINKVEPTPLQQIALSLAENLQAGAEQNELTFNMKNHNFVQSDKHHSDRYHWGGIADGYVSSRGQRQNYRNYKKNTSTTFRNRLPNSSLHRRNQNKDDGNTNKFRTHAMRPSVAKATF